MPRKAKARYVPCPKGHTDVRASYDVANDCYFASCWECGTEGPRKAEEKECKIAWTKRQNLLCREPEEL